MNKKKIKVLFVCPFAEDGGGITRWTKNILEYYQSLEDSCVTLHLINTCRSVSIIENRSQISEAWHLLLDYRRIIASLLQAIRRERFDVMHIATTAGNGLLRDEILLCIARMKGIKAFLHFHFGKIPTMDSDAPRMWYWLKKISQKADGLIVLDETSKTKLEKEGLKNVFYLPNPLSLKTEAIISKIGSQKRTPHTVLFVGHCVRSKGLFELVEACKEMGNVTLILIGEADKEVESLLSSCDSNYNIQYKGVLPYEKVIEEMLNCDIFVLPSYSEGFPNVIIEAMACGCAIISTKVGAIPQILENGNEKYGLLVNPRNVSELMSALQSLIDDEKLKSVLRSSVTIRVKNNYSISSIWNTMEEIWYSKILS